MRSKAAVLIKNKKIKLLNLNLPTLKKGQVLVKISYASICYTQIQEIDGERGKDHYIPHCLGHEATGKVIKINQKVKKVKSGDNVCLTWVFSKGINAGGSIYSYNKKNIINAGPVNTFSQYAIVSENKIHKLSKNSDLKKSVLLGCAAPTAFNCIFLNTNKVNKKKILILGCGGVGLLAVYAAKLMKFKEIAVIDKFKKLEIAKKYGATKSLLNKDLKNFKDSFDYVVECSGNSRLINESLTYAKKFGGQVFVIGNYKHKTKIRIDPWQLLFGKNIWILGKQFNYDRHFNQFEKYLKKFNTSYFFGKKIYSLNKINHAIRDFRSGKVIRPLIKM